MTSATIYGADHGVTRPSEDNARILAEKETAFNKRDGARVGDYVRFPDGREERISHHWGDSVQTSTGGSWYLGENYVSFSGGLNRAIPVEGLTLTDERKAGDCWFFDRDWRRAHAAIYARIGFRVFTYSG